MSVASPLRPQEREPASADARRMLAAASHPGRTGADGGAERCTWRSGLGAEPSGDRAHLHEAEFLIGRVEVEIGVVKNLLKAVDHGCAELVRICARAGVGWFVEGWGSTARPPR